MRGVLASRVAMTAVLMTERPAYHLAERILDNDSDSDV
jgi:hypothetical protein